MTADPTRHEPAHPPPTIPRTRLPGLIPRTLTPRTPTPTGDPDARVPTRGEESRPPAGAGGIEVPADTADTRVPFDGGESQSPTDTAEAPAWTGDGQTLVRRVGPVLVVGAVDEETIRVLAGAGEVRPSAGGPGRPPACDLDRLSPGDEARLPAGGGEIPVLVGGSAAVALAAVDPWLVADLADVVDGPLLLVADGMGAVGADGSVPPACLLADRLGVAVTAADGAPRLLRDGTVVVDGSWVSFLPGGEYRRGGQRRPEPWWEAGLPAHPHTESVPAGLWLRHPDAPARPDDPLHDLPPDPEHLLVVLGHPDDPPPGPAAAAALLSALPGDIRAAAILVDHGRTGLPRVLADTLRAPLRVRHSLHAGPWPPFAVESLYRPDTPSTPLLWTAPAQLPPSGRPGTYRLTEDWVVDVIPRGLLARPETLIPDPRWDTPAGPTADLVLVATTDVPPTVVDALTALTENLPPETKAVLRILPTSPTALAAARRLSVGDVVTPPPAPIPAASGQARVVVTPSGRVLPAAPPLPPSTLAVVNATRALHPPGPPSADPLFGEERFASTWDRTRITRHPLSTSPPPRAAEPATPSHENPGEATSHVPTVAITRVPLTTTPPSPHPTPSPSSAPPPLPAPPPSPLPSPALHSAAARAQAAPPPAASPAPEPLTRSVPQSASPMPALITSELVGTQAQRERFAPVAVRTPGSGRALHSVALPATGSTTALPTTGPVAAAPVGGPPAAIPAAEPAGPVLSAARPEVPVDARSTPEDRRRVRAALGARFDAASRVVAGLLAERPGLRGGGGDQAALLTELTVARVFAADPEDEYDTVFHTCLAAGLRRLPTLRGVVARRLPATRCVVGETVSLPLPVMVDATAPDGPAALIWTTSARRVDGLVAGAGVAVLPAHTRLRVLAVEPGLVLAAESSAPAETALDRLRQVCPPRVTEAADSVAPWWEPVGA
ncbi:hypothetical protein [Actinokineospora sp. 24-640]